MGHRITWRSRPRHGEYPWPYKTKQVTLANILYGPPFDYELLIGPLDMKAVVEILYRVTKFSFSVSITGDVLDNSDPPVPVPTTETASGEITLDDGLGNKPNELEEFTFNRSNDTGTAHESYQLRDNSSPVNILWPIDPNSFGAALRDSPIYEDENGDFWLQGYFYFNTEHFQAGNFVSTQAGDVDPFDASLELYSGTYQIKAYAGYGSDVTANSLTITATEWHPFKTTAGDDAWNTTTGAAANGGPAA